MTKRISLSFAMAILAIISTACKGGQPAEPTNPPVPPTTPGPSTTLVTISAKDVISDAGVPGVAVQGPTSGQTDAEGRFVVEVPSSMNSTFNLTLDKSGYVGPCETFSRVGRTNFSLWPLRNDNSLVVVKQAVYGDQSAPNNPGFREMRRVNGPISFLVDSALAENAVAMDVLNTKARALQDVIGWSVTVDRMPIAGSAVFVVDFDNTIAAAAQVTRNFSSTTIVGGRLTFYSMAMITPSTTGHEMAHTFGLNHHTALGSVGVSHNSNITDYSQTEVDIMRAMRSAPNGLVFPCNDRGLASTLQSGRGQSEVIR